MATQHLHFDRLLVFFWRRATGKARGNLAKQASGLSLSLSMSLLGAVARPLTNEATKSVYLTKASLAVVAAGQVGTQVKSGGRGDMCALVVSGLPTWQRADFRDGKEGWALYYSGQEASGGKQASKQAREHGRATSSS